MITAPSSVTRCSPYDTLPSAHPNPSHPNPNHPNPNHSPLNHSPFIRYQDTLRAAKEARAAARAAKAAGN